MQTMAHEFWIAPDAHMIEPGDALAAQLLVGSDMRGETYPYLSHRFLSFDIDDDGGKRPYRGNEGDSPAMTTTLETPGLTTLIYHSKPSRLVYRDWETFLNYTAEEGLDGAVEAHLEAGLPRTGFAEFYSRCAKALVQVGPVRDSDRDRAHGLPFELIALDTPFESDRSALPVRLEWQGRIAADMQIAIFRKTKGSVERTILRTDDEGQAVIPLEPSSRYLLGAVHLEREDADADWRSHWASLTFATP